MNSEEIMGALKVKFPEVSLQRSERNPDSLEMAPENLGIIAGFLKESPDLSFDFLICCFAIDWMDSLEVVYVFHSYDKNHQIVLRAKLDRKEPRIDSLSHLYPTADWHEREAYDLFGVQFSNHPNLTRLLLPDDWEGYPMRKDYTHPNLIRRPENN